MGSYGLGLVNVDPLGVWRGSITARTHEAKYVQAVSVRVQGHNAKDVGTGKFLSAGVDVLLDRSLGLDALRGEDSDAGDTVVGEPL